MSDPKTPLWDKLAKVARVILLIAITVVLTLIVIGPRSTGLPNPLSVPRAQAEGICAAPGYLLLTTKVGGASKFYVVDSTRQVFCVYETNGDQLRLVGARKFDKDAEIFDASIPTPGLPRGFEGHRPGIDRKTAAKYAEDIKAAKEKAAKK